VLGVLDAALLGVLLVVLLFEDPHAASPNAAASTNAPMPAAFGRSFVSFQC
jgi:hypothetical protein